MLTLFALPKPFEGHIGVIQRNAIRSWAKLSAVEIILLGGEAGTAEMAADVGAAHIVEVERNQFGTPLVSSCFAVAAAASKGELMAYVNSDIILMDDFRRAVDRVARLKRRFLMAGRRTDLDVRDSLALSAGWEVDLRERAHREGHLIGPGAIDYFVFRRGLWPLIPPFAIGRWVWDNWLLYEAVRSGSTLIDATPSVLAVHQAHGYDHFDAPGPTRVDGPESDANHALHPDPITWFELNHASRVLHPHGLLPAWTRERLRQRLITWLLHRPRALRALRNVKQILRKLRGRHPEL